MPARPDDADPFVGERSNRSLRAFAFGDLLFVVSSGPEGMLAADGAIACFSSNPFPLSLDADRAPQLKASVGRKSDLQMRDVLQNEDPMKNIATNPKSAAIISFFLVLPFAILDFLFNPLRRQNFLDPIVLFGLLWLLPMIFIVIFAPILQSVRAGNNILTSPVTLLFRVAFLVFIAWLWGVAIIDQVCYPRAAQQVIRADGGIACLSCCVCKSGCAYSPAAAQFQRWIACLA